MFWPFVVLCALQSADQASIHTGVRASPSGSMTLQPWLKGLMAVVVFLFVIFVFLILNRLLGNDRREVEEEGDQEDVLGYQEKVVEVRRDYVEETSL
ncbi:small integral membrane protein 24-like [Syngnathus acus]|uniref:small integral membrane protein 24-like n=1 Tax=Syngnathus acus TaxID=161584 RepID=UPI001885B759|nr:small integral membrane protein 24-like [Syngnathus acus]